MFDPFKKLKLAGAFLGVADEVAAAGPDSLDISELFGRLNLKDLRSMSLPAERLLEQPGVRALFESRYLPEPEPLDRLTALGEGTLGFEYARYMRHHKLSPPTPSRRVDFNDPAAYLAERVRMTHPLLHLITEYDATPLGELALQAYYIGQTGNLISGVIISSALLQITRDTPDLLGPALEVTSEAFQRGKIARSFLGIAWEELWSAQVPQLRELVEIPARSSAVALLRYAPPAPEPRASRSGSFSAFANSEDGLAALGRANSGPYVSNASAASSSPPPRPRNFTGFGGAPLKPEPDPPRQPERSAPAREPAAPEQRPRASSSSSSLLASFMALAEQAANPEPPAAAPKPQPRPQPPQQPPQQPPPQPQARPQPPPVRPQPPQPQPPQPQPPQPPPPRVEARGPARPPPPPAAPAKADEPGYKIEEAAKNIMPALSPDDPDYF